MVKVPRLRWYLTAVAALAVILVPGRAVRHAAAADPPPPVTTGLQLWYEADTETEADGAPVAQWADKSGFGRDLSSDPDGGAEATMRRNAVNGRAAIEFNGTSSMLKTYNSTFTI